MVGNVTNMGAVNSGLSGTAVQLRQLMDFIREQQEYITGLGSAGLQALGFSSADATTVLNDWSYMNTISGVYYGTATQGTVFNFDNALSSLWAGA